MQSIWRSLCGSGFHFSKSLICAGGQPVNHLQQTSGHLNRVLGNEPIFSGYKTLSSNGIYQSVNSGANFLIRSMTTSVNPEISDGQDSSGASPEVIHPPRIKFKRLDKTARHIMNILDKEAVEKVRSEREIPAIEPGYIVQLKVEVPENKRRVSVLKGIVIATRNAGLHSTFRLRRLVAGVGVESVFPLYSPNIKEFKVLEKKKVRRAKLYYLRDRMNALKK
ncbi:50S ribosomal protein L19, chloroplastic-like [Dioscorea cayenensis subsp. rotundata]|uniref:50S ribosomal protein L19, chloroplastic-like n=1 Tax=Dioscorea cayennensis subsp. rotundata TaxID=55577 RepID=A0AB40CE91_DIOCR|nr:50S ribosomal protein L19, chloroplastic-like [Dioscorea cayenensis subsp. rotundata]